MGLNDIPVIDPNTSVLQDEIFYVSETLKISIQLSDIDGDIILGLPSAPFDTSAQDVPLNGTFIF